MWKIRYIVFTWLVCYLTSAQEYLPPKINGGAKKPISEPTLPINYEYTYDVQDNTVSLDFGHTEKRKDDRASGSYHVLLPDGRTQLVEYEAGPEGYKPQVMYMGTATYPSQTGGGAGGDKFEGYHYNAASNRQSVRQSARNGARQPTSAPSPAPAPPVLYAPAENTAE